MLAYTLVWWRMVEWLQFGDVRHDTAVSLYPTIVSFNTYRLRLTHIVYLISHIGYARYIPIAINIYGIGIYSAGYTRGI